MGTTGKIVVVTLALAGLGAVRMPIEARVTREFREERLLQPRIDIGTEEKLDQTAAMVAFGGLRTLIAAMFNLRAFGYFERLDWGALEDTYETICMLAPHTVFYWDNAAWHLAYNAASDFKERRDLPPLRRRQLWHDSILKGIDILKDGIRNNPDDWTLARGLGDIQTSPFKLRDYKDAAKWYEYAIGHGAPDFVKRFRLFAIARIPGREKETLELARQYHADPKMRVPTLDCLLFTCEYRANPNQPIGPLIDKIFGSPQKAWNELSTYHLTDMPGDGIEPALRWLGNHLPRQPEPKPVREKEEPQGESQEGK
jgi:hypothetical protein